MNYSRYGLEAFRAGLTFFSINRKVDGKIAFRAVGVKKVPQGGASAGNAFVQYITKALDPFIPLGQSDFPRWFGGSDARVVKRFAGIDISNSGDLLRIHNK